MKNLLCSYLIFFSFPLLSFAQQDQLSDPIPFFMAIIVNNLDTSINWYSQTLGFEILNQVDMAERGFRQANLKRGAAMLELIELNTALYPQDILEGKSKKTKIAGFFKFGFVVKDFDKWLDQLSNSREALSDQVVRDPNSGSRMMIILDPDGNRIQLFEQ